MQNGRITRRWDGRSNGTTHDGSGDVSSLIEQGKEDFLSFFLSFDLGHEGFFLLFLWILRDEG
jgi:hypothetical protein